MGIKINTKRDFVYPFDEIVGATPKLIEEVLEEGSDQVPKMIEAKDEDGNVIMEGGTHYKFSLSFQFINSEDFDYTKKSGVGLLKNAIRQSLVSAEGFDDERGMPLTNITEVQAMGILDAVEQISPEYYSMIISKFEGLTVKK